MNFSFTCLPTDDDVNGDCQNINMPIKDYSESNPIEFLSNER